MANSSESYLIQSTVHCLLCSKINIRYCLIKQDCGLSATRSLVSYLPPMVRSQMGMKLGEKKALCGSGMNLNSSALHFQRYLKYLSNFICNDHNRSRSFLGKPRLLEKERKIHHKLPDLCGTKIVFDLARMAV